MIRHCPTKLAYTSRTISSFGTLAVPRVFDGGLCVDIWKPSISKLYKHSHSCGSRWAQVTLISLNDVYRRLQLQQESLALASRYSAHVTLSVDSSLEVQQDDAYTKLGV